jgi:branched-chain amino acid transport system substrate-binding protein
MNIPLLASAAGDPRFLDPFRKNIFSGAPVPSKSQVPLTLDFVLKTLKQPKTLSLLSSTDAFEISQKALVLAEYDRRGIKVLSQGTFAATDTDFTAQIQAVKNAHADVVQVLGYPQTTSRVLNQVRRAGITVPLFGDSAQADDAMIRLAGQAAEGYYVPYGASNQFSSDDTGVMGQFRAKFKKMFPDADMSAYPNQFTQYAYADMYVIADALRRAGSNLTRDSYITAMNSTTDFVAGQKSGNGSYWSWAFPIGLPRTFTPTDHQGAHTIVIFQIKNGHFVKAQ